jgi:hypothetical protein
MNLDKYMEILLRVWDTDEQTVDDERGTKIVLIASDMENEVGHHPLSYPEPMATLMIQHYSLLSAADQLKLRNCEGGLVIWDMESILAPEYKLCETFDEADKLYSDMAYDIDEKAGRH